MNQPINKLSRYDGRVLDQKREVTLQTGYYDYAEGSCLVSFGRTKVLCVATVDESVPPHLRGKGQGWVTAEYSMLPRSSPERIRRERTNVGGRTQEIQRLIGRALRSVTRTEYLGERTIMLDCDVIQADGGTRTASVTGAFVALVQAIQHLARHQKVSMTNPFPVSDFVSAISVGVVKGQPVLDLDYKEDSSADTDMNLIMTAAGKIIEIQGTAEKDPFSREELLSMISLGQKGCLELCQMQKSILGPLEWKR
jgi:ribonuclease PH